MGKKNQAVWLKTLIFLCVLVSSFCTAGVSYGVDAAPGRWSDSDSGLSFSVDNTGKVLNMTLMHGIEASCYNTDGEESYRTLLGQVYVYDTDITTTASSFTASGTYVKKLTGEQRSYTYYITGHANSYYSMSGTYSISTSWSMVWGDTGTWCDGTYTGNWYASTTSVIPNGSITINNGAAFTDSLSVNLTLSATARTGSLALMRFSNDGSTWSEWESYATSKTWDMAVGEGTKMVYVQFRDSSGNISLSRSDTIIYASVCYRITATAGTGGAIAPAGVTLIGTGYPEYQQKYTITPNCLKVSNVLVDGVSAGAVTSYTFSNITDNHTIEARFKLSPTADFSASPISGTSVPLIVNFKDKSACATAWLWSFGDGATSTVSNPIHTYTAKGYYTVSLTATNAEGVDTVVKTAFIKIGVNAADIQIDLTVPDNCSDNLIFSTTINY